MGFIRRPFGTGFGLDLDSCYGGNDTGISTREVCQPCGGRVQVDSRRATGRAASVIV